MTELNPYHRLKKTLGPPQAKVVGVVTRKKNTLTATALLGDDDGNPTKTWPLREKPSRERSNISHLSREVWQIIDSSWCRLREGMAVNVFKERMDVWIIVFFNYASLRPVNFVTTVRYIYIYFFFLKTFADAALWGISVTHLQHPAALGLEAAGEIQCWHHIHARDARLEPGGATWSNKLLGTAKDGWNLWGHWLWIRLSPHPHNPTHIYIYIEIK